MFPCICFLSFSFELQKHKHKNTKGSLRIHNFFNEERKIWCTVSGCLLLHWEEGDLQPSQCQPDTQADTLVCLSCRLWHILFFLLTSWHRPWGSYGKQVTWNCKTLWPLKGKRTLKTECSKEKSHKLCNSNLKILPVLSLGKGPVENFERSSLKSLISLQFCSWVW